MINSRSVRNNNKSKIVGSNSKLQRSRSKSPNNQKANLKNSNIKLSKQSPLKGNQKGQNNSKLNRSRSRSPSPQRSINGKNQKGKAAKGLQNSRLSRSKSEKKGLNRSLSQSRVQNPPKSSNSPSKLRLKNEPSSAKQNSNNKSSLMKSARTPSINQSGKKPQEDRIRERSPHSINESHVASNIKTEQKQMGIIFTLPEHDKVLFKPLEITDEVYEKYHDMISNDNDAGYVVNAMPELLNSQKKEDESSGRDFVSGKISRLSGLFDNITVDKVVTASKKVPHYYNGQCGKNLTTLKIVLLTKFKVEVDVGFVMYSVDGDKLTVFRVYLSRIYRRMNYLGFVYMEMWKHLMSKHSGCDRWSIFILERNVNVHKFFKYLGFKIEKIATESKNKTVDYFQEFTIKRKELNTVVASMK